MTKTLSAFAALVLPLIGASVLVTDKTGSESTYRITKLSDKLGSLKDGSKGEYVVLQNAADETVVINLHPASAKRLITNGDEAGMKLVVAAVEGGAGEAEALAEAGIPETAPEDVAPAVKTKKVKVAKEPKVKAPKVAKEPKVAVAKEPSKKELFMTAYTAGVAAGSDRKTIKAAIADLGLSDNGFNTYYQNAKSGKWA